MAVLWERGPSGQNSYSLPWTSEETKSRGHSVPAAASTGPNKLGGSWTPGSHTWVLGRDLGRVGLQTVDEVSAARGYQSRSEDPDHIQAANATGDCGLSSQATRGFPRTPLCLQDAQRHQNWISLLGYCGGREGRTMELSRNGLAQRKPRLGETLNPVPNGPCHPPSLSFLLSSFTYARPQKANRRWMEDRLNHFPSLIS